MAKVVVNNQEREIKDGSPIKDACKEMGVAFGCEDGMCGTCIIEVDEGSENLPELNDAEEALGMDGKYRLACQCKLKKGTLKVKY